MANMKINVYYVRPNFIFDGSRVFKDYRATEPIAKEDCALVPYYAGVIESEYVPADVSDFEYFWHILNWSCWGGELVNGYVRLNDHTYKPAIDPIIDDEFGYCNNEYIFEYSKNGCTKYVAYVTHNDPAVGSMYMTFDNIEDAILNVVRRYSIHRQRYIGNGELCKVITKL